MANNKMKTRVAYTLILLLLGTVTGAMAAPEPPVLAGIENEGTALVFYPATEFSELILTVTGPCDFQYRQVIKEGQVPYFKLDETTIDGAYTFNLMRNEKIDRETIAELKLARFENDTEKPKALCREGKLPGPPVSQSSGFRVIERRIIFGGEQEETLQGPTPTQGIGASGLNASGGDLQVLDFVINDDLIVDGSACIGFDCVNGESFGFDTIRVKENNLRIKFDDTSVAASFPRNDWQLTANDSANGGASKFSIDDISGNRTPFTVEANARSHSLYVDDGGRIGNRTSTPSVEIHTIDGDTPTLRLQQDGSSGFAPQTWDVAGNETNFFIRDVTNGSTLPFRIRPGAPTSSIFVDVDGDVGMGTSSPDSELHISDSTDDAKFTIEGNGGFTGFEVDNTGSSEAGAWLVTEGGGSALAIDHDADPVQEFRVFTNGNVEISGSLTTATQTLPDYVFETDYDLLPLKELSAFVQREKHLPKVPSAEEVERNGGRLNMTEMQHLFLEKIEELTLYTLEQESRIEKLQARLDKIENID